MTATLTPAAIVIPALASATPSRRRDATTAG